MAGLRIAEMQERIGLKDAELARRLGTNQTQLGRLKKGDRGMSHDWMRRFARALECHVIDLLPDADYPNRPSAIDMRMLEKLRSAGSDPADLLDLLAGIDKMVKRQVERRATKGNLVGDPVQNAQLADIWGELSPDQRGHMLAMMRAATSMKGGVADAA